VVSDYYCTPRGITPSVCLGALLAALIFQQYYSLVRYRVQVIISNISRTRVWFIGYFVPIRSRLVYSSPHTVYILLKFFPELLDQHRENYAVD
jgi:hypothetical protein